MYRINQYNKLRYETTMESYIWGNHKKIEKIYNAV